MSTNTNRIWTQCIPQNRRGSERSSESVLESILESVLNSILDSILESVLDSVYWESVKYQNLIKYIKYHKMKRNEKANGMNANEQITNS